MELENFVQIGLATSIQEFERRLIEMAIGFDFPIISSSFIIDGKSAEDLPKFFNCGNTPQAFASMSINIENSRRDPVLRHLKCKSFPVVYNQKFYVDAGAADLWEEQAPFGYKAGISVVLHLPKGQHFILGFDRDIPLPKQEAEILYLASNLQLMAAYAHVAAQNLLVPKQISCHEPRKLTPREQQVLQLTMSGLRSKQVADRMCIDHQTVNFHLRGIYAKFGVRSKYEAVIVAMRNNVF